MKLAQVLLATLFCTSATAQVKQYELKRGTDKVMVNDICVDNNGGILTSYQVQGSQAFSGIVKTNARGKVIWTREGIGMHDNAMLKPAANGDYLVLNKGQMPQYARIDNEGKTKWSEFSGFITIGGLQSTGITETPNGTVVVCGHNNFLRSMPNVYRSGWLKFAEGTTGKNRGITKSYEADPASTLDNFYFNDVTVAGNNIIVGGEVTNVGVQKSAIWKMDTAGAVISSWYIDTTLNIAGVNYNKHSISRVHTADNKLYVSGIFHNNKTSGDTTRQEAIYIAELDTVNATYQANIYWLQGACYLNSTAIQFTRDGNNSYAFAISPNKFTKGAPGYEASKTLIAVQVINNNLTYVKRIQMDTAVIPAALVAKQDSIIIGGTLYGTHGYYSYLHAPTNSYPSCNISFDTVGSMSFAGRLVTGPATKAVAESDTVRSNTDSTFNKMQIELICGDTSTSVNDVSTKEIVLYPNPNNGSFTIACEGQKLTNNNIVLIDVTGRKVPYTISNSQTDKATITVNAQVHGIIYCIIQTDNGTVMRKAINIL